MAQSTTVDDSFDKPFEARPSAPSKEENDFKDSQNPGVGGEKLERKNGDSGNKESEPPKKPDCSEGSKVSEPGPIKLAPYITISNARFSKFLRIEAGFNDDCADSLVRALEKRDSDVARAKHLSKTLYEHFLDTESNAPNIPLVRLRERHVATPVRLFSRYDILRACVQPKIKLPPEIAPLMPAPSPPTPTQAHMQPAHMQAYPQSYAIQGQFTQQFHQGYRVPRQVQPQAVNQYPVHGVSPQASGPARIAGRVQPGVWYRGAGSPGVAAPPKKQTRKYTKRKWPTTKVSFRVDEEEVADCTINYFVRKGAAAERTRAEHGETSCHPGVVGLKLYNPEPEESAKTETASNASSKQAENPKEGSNDASVEGRRGKEEKDDHEPEYLVARFKDSHRVAKCCVMIWGNAATCRKHPPPQPENSKSELPNFSMFSLRLEKTTLLYSDLLQKRRAENKRKRENTSEENKEVITTWVQCDRCDKWRRVVEAPVDDAEWHCGMIKGKSCEDREDSVVYEEEEIIESENQIKDEKKNRKPGIKSSETRISNEGDTKAEQVGTRKQFRESVKKREAEEIEETQASRYPRRSRRRSRSTQENPIPTPTSKHPTNPEKSPSTSKSLSITLPKCNRKNHYQKKENTHPGPREAPVSPKPPFSNTSTLHRSGSAAGESEGRGERRRGRKTTRESKGEGDGGGEEDERKGWGRYPKRRRRSSSEADNTLQIVQPKRVPRKKRIKIRPIRTPERTEVTEPSEPESTQVDRENINEEQVPSKLTGNRKPRRSPRKVRVGKVKIRGPAPGSDSVEQENKGPQSTESNAKSTRSMVIRLNLPSSTQEDNSSTADQPKRRRGRPRAGTRGLDRDAGMSSNSKTNKREGTGRGLKLTLRRSERRKDA